MQISLRPEKNNKSHCEETSLNCKCKITERFDGEPHGKRILIYYTARGNIWNNCIGLETGQTHLKKIVWK